MDNGTIDMLIATYTITDDRKASYAMSNPTTMTKLVSSFKPNLAIRNFLI